MHIKRLINSVQRLAPMPAQCLCTLSCGQGPDTGHALEAVFGSRKQGALLPRTGMPFAVCKVGYDFYYIL